MNSICKSILLAVLLCTGLLTACSTSAPVTDAAGSASDELKMKAILISSASQVTAGQGNTMTEYAKAQDVDFSVEYYEQNPATEANMIENAVTAGVDVLIVHNQSAGDCVEEINDAVAAGVKVVLYATDIPDANYTCLYTEDAYEAGLQAGRMAGKWAAENLVAKGTPVVAAVGTYSVTPIAVDRCRGIRDGLLEYCPDSEIVGEYEMAYKEEGLQVGENLLQSHPNVNLVIGINDQSACGVYEAFRAAGRTANDTAMFGIDGTDEAMYYIHEGTMFRGTIAIPTNEIGRKMVQTGIDLVNGTAEIPEDRKFYWVPNAITSDNVSEYKDIWGHLEK